MSVVVRFAPSPTGYLHVGGQRTALYNYLFARKNGGKFILRIEDTDQNRYVEGAVENLLNSLKQMGLEYDAGPGKDDEYSPYFQSQRQEIYHKEVNHLLKNGHAYRCFCSSERLEKLRDEQVARGEAPGYDGKCRTISFEESATRAKLEPYVVRLKVPEEGAIEFDDIIRGHISVEHGKIDDQVLLKSDGFPTYHLANVVDDHYMKITHVIRGEEWLPSLPKHLLLYDFFNWNPPQFAHLPLLLNADRSKLSKRQGDVAVEDYLRKGYLPEALNNYLALLGWNPGTDDEIFSIEQLTELFSLDRVNKSGAVFDLTKLKWMNSQYIQKLPHDDFIHRAKPFLTDLHLSDMQTDQIVPLFQNNIETLADLPEKMQPVLNTPSRPDELEAFELLKSDDTRIVLTMYMDQIGLEETIDSEIFKQTMKSIQKESGVKGKNLWMPIRLALTGQMHGPELGKIAEFLGRDENINRIRAAISWYR